MGGCRFAIHCFKKPSRNRLYEIFESPSGYYHVETENKIARQNGQTSDNIPWTARSESPECADGIAVPGTSERELAKHDRNAENQHTYNINE